MSDRRADGTSAATSPGGRGSASAIVLVAGAAAVLALAGFALARFAASDGSLSLLRPDISYLLADETPVVVYVHDEASAQAAMQLEDIPRGVVVVAPSPPGAGVGAVEPITLPPRAGAGGGPPADDPSEDATGDDPTDDDTHTRLFFIDECIDSDDPDCPEGEPATIIGLFDEDEDDDLQSAEFAIVGGLHMSLYPYVLASDSRVRCDPGIPSAEGVPLLITTSKPVTDLHVRFGPVRGGPSMTLGPLESNNREAAAWLFALLLGVADRIHGTIDSGLQICLNLPIDMVAFAGAEFFVEVIASDIGTREIVQVDARFRIPGSEEFDPGRRPPVTGFGTPTSLAVDPWGFLHMQVPTGDPADGWQLIVEVEPHRFASCPSGPAAGRRGSTEGMSTIAGVRGDDYPWDRTYDHSAYYYVVVPEGERHMLCIHWLIDGELVETEHRAITPPSHLRVDVFLRSITMWEDRAREALAANSMRVEFPGFLRGMDSSCGSTFPSRDLDPEDPEIRLLRDSEGEVRASIWTPAIAELICSSGGWMVDHFSPAVARYRLARDIGQPWEVGLERVDGIVLDNTRGCVDGGGVAVLCPESTVTRSFDMPYETRVGFDLGGPTYSIDLEFILFDGPSDHPGWGISDWEVGAPTSIVYRTTAP
jgi:hypothetical protein